MRTANLGKILGALGLLSLLSSPYTYFISSGSAWAAGAKALLGLALIIVFAATNMGDLGQVASRKSSFFFFSTGMTLIVLLAGLVAVNTIAAKKDKSWDLTNKKIFTLAPQTTQVLHGLQQPVKAIAFLVPSDPGYDVADQLLLRYHREAPDQFDYLFKDPRKSPDLAAKYELREGQTTVILTRGEGAKESHTAINLLPGQELMEQDLTNALAKLSTVSQQKVYFLTGHGEWPLQSPDGEGQSLAELSKSLQQEGYSTDSLNLAGKKEVPRDAALLMIAGAHTPLAAPEEKDVRDYLDEGGRVMLFAEAQTDVGMKDTLAKYGVEIDPGIIADDQFAVGSPYIILTGFYSDHELGRALKKLGLNVQLPTVRGLTVLHQGLLDGVHAEPVLLTSPFAWEQTTLTDQPARQSGQKAGSIPVVVASSRQTQGVKDPRFGEARLVVFGDSELLVDANWGHEPNRNMVMNAIAWTTNQVNKITIRPPDRDISTLDLEPPTLRRIRFVSTDVLPFTLLGIGLAIWLRRRNQ